MKTIEALDWKLWEIYQIAQGFAKHFDIDLEKKYVLYGQTIHMGNIS